MLNFNNPTLLLKKLIIFFFFYMILEGILRKWIFPGLSTQIYFIKDILLIIIYSIALRYNLIFQSTYSKIFIFFIVLISLFGFMGYNYNFNGIISYISHEVFKIDPIFLNVNSARRSLGILLVRKKDGGSPTKEQVLKWVTGEILDQDYSWPKKTLKSGPRKGLEILIPECYDMADAYVMARAGQIVEQK